MTPHERLRWIRSERPGAYVVHLTGKHVEALLVEHDEALRTRTLGGPVTGTRVPGEPGQWANAASTEPPLATPALADYTVPRPDERPT